MKRIFEKRAKWLDIHFGEKRELPHRKKSRPAMKFKAKRIHKQKYGV
jgi:hypothetical protein